MSAGYVRPHKNGGDPDWGIGQAGGAIPIAAVDGQGRNASQRVREAGNGPLATIEHIGHDPVSFRSPASDPSSVIAG